MNNQLRSEAALVALKAFNNYLPSGDIDEAVSDLICDIMHLTDDPDLGYEHLDINWVLETAQRCYEYEK